MDEEDGYDADNTLFNRYGEKPGHRKSKNDRAGRYNKVDEDELQAFEGRNFYDDGWEYCALDEEVLKEDDSHGVLVQDNSLIEAKQSNRKSRHKVMRQPSTYILNISDMPKIKSSSRQDDVIIRKLLSWLQVRGEDDRLDEVLTFLREL